VLRLATSQRTGWPYGRTYHHHHHHHRRRRRRRRRRDLNEENETYSRFKNSSSLEIDVPQCVTVLQLGGLSLAQPL
jgi:hypothetical protein